MPGGAELSEKLPDEMFQIVEAFKKFVREQKAYRDQKFDVDPILEVDREAEEFMLAFQRVAVDSDINSQLIQQINDDTTKLLRHAELSYSLLRSHIANNPSLQQQQQQSTQPTLSSLFGSTPAASQQQQQNQQQHNSTFGLFLGSNYTTSNLNTTSGFTTTIAANHVGSALGGAGTTNTTSSQHTNNHLNNDTINQTSSNQNNQFSNTTSSQYFAELADQFETRMKAYGEQIKELKMSLDSIIRTYNADELFKWLKKQHEALGEIAAKVYITHERIMEKKSELDKSNSHAAQQHAADTTRMSFT